MKIAHTGGNWQGIEYLTYAEHDRCVRASLAADSKADKEFLYGQEMQVIIEERSQS